MSINYHKISGLKERASLPYCAGQNSLIEEAADVLTLEYLEYLGKTCHLLCLVSTAHLHASESLVLSSITPSFAIGALGLFLVAFFLSFSLMRALFVRFKVHLDLV